MKAPAELNSCTRSVPRSVTYRLPVVGSEAMPAGIWDLPLPEPRSSNIPSEVPVLEYSCTLPASGSEMYRFPPEKARPGAAPENHPVEPNPDDVFARGRELLHEHAVGVQDPDVAAGVKRDRGRPGELAGAEARGAELPEERPGRGELLHAVVGVVGHVDVPGCIGGDAADALELAFA